MLKRILTAISALILLIGFVAPVSAATTYNGPLFTVSPDVIPSGGTTTLILSSDTSPTFGGAPAGSFQCNPALPSTCFFPLQSCPTGATFWYGVYQVVLTLANGTDFYLGSATTSGLANPFAGRYTVDANPNLRFAPSINATAGDSLNIPISPGASNFYVGSSSLPNPPNSVNPEGPYYWWNHDTDFRENSGWNPTATTGTYLIDVEGEVYCGGTLPLDTSTPATTLASYGTRIFFNAHNIAFTVTTLPPPSGATRTIGWWQTHLDLEQATWAAYLSAHPSGATICGVTITTSAEAMGGFWASISKTSTGDKRGQPYQSEMTLIQQWIGALLNVQAFGTSDGGLLANGVSACNSGDKTAITNAANALETFNGGGELVNSPFPTGNATPQAAQQFADIPFWDVISQ